MASERDSVVWFGLEKNNREHRIGDKTGNVVRKRTIKRHPLDEAWSKETWGGTKEGPNGQGTQTVVKARSTVERGIPNDKDVPSHV